MTPLRASESVVAVALLAGLDLGVFGGPLVRYELLSCHVLIYTDPETLPVHCRVWSAAWVYSCGPDSRTVRPVAHSAVITPQWARQAPVRTAGWTAVVLCGG
jgi:hypothetical protein